MGVPAEVRPRAQPLHARLDSGLAALREPSTQVRRVSLSLSLFCAEARPEPGFLMISAPRAVFTRPADRRPPRPAQLHQARRLGRVPGLGRHAADGRRQPRGGQPGARAAAAGDRGVREDGAHGEARAAAEGLDAGGGLQERRREGVQAADWHVAAGREAGASTVPLECGSLVLTDGYRSRLGR